MEIRLHLLTLGCLESELSEIKQPLEDDGYRVAVERVDSVDVLLDANLWDVVLVDADRFDIQDALAHLEAAAVPLIALGDAIDPEAALAAIKAGANDYVPKADSEQLIRAIYRTQHESAARYQMVSELVSDYAYALRCVDGEHLEREWITGAFTRITGFAPGESGWMEMVHPDDRPILQAHTQRLLAGEQHAAEYRIYTKSGELRWVCDRGHPRMDAEGERVVRIYGAGEDITARKQMEAKLRHERDLLSRIMEVGPAAISIVNREGQIDFANQQAERVLGLNRDKITKRLYNTPAWRHTKLDGSPFADEDQPFSRVMKTKRPVYNVYQVIEHPDGRRVVLSINGAPLLDESGKVDRVVFIIEDITQRREAEAALEQSQRQLQAIFDNAQDGIMLADDAACYVDVNPALCKMTGYTHEELLGMSVYDLTPDVDVETGKRLWEAFLKEGQQSGEYALQRKDDTTLDIEYRSVAHIVPGLHLSILRDITARKRADQARLQEFRRLEQLITPPPAHVTAKTFGLVPLHQSTEGAFDKFVKRYENLLEEALEEKAYKVENQVSRSLQALAEQLGLLRGGPRDVIEIHTLALKRRVEQANPIKAQAYTEEGRLMVLKLMGYLLTYYRDYFTGAWRMSDREES